MQIMQRTLAWLLSSLLILVPVVPAQAAMVGTGEIVSPAAAHADQSALRHLLEQQDARQQLQAWGVAPSSLDARIASLSDSELARINQGIESLQAGSGSVLGVLVLIFVIFVITDVIGATDIFPFIHPVR